jgi:hypothetical protein
VGKWWVVVFLLSAWGARADLPVMADEHPIGWMHGLNLGSSPGWEKNFWIHQQLSLANVWSMPADFVRPSTGKTLHYQADYEQTSEVLSAGFALSDGFALALETAAASRGSDLLDKGIDDYHAALGFYRYQRDAYARGKSQFVVQTDGVSKLSSESASGLSYGKVYFKFWPLRYGGCRCGFGFDLAIKWPMGDAARGLSSGGTDYTFAPALALPLGRASSFKISASVTYAEKNEVFEDWPRNKWLFGTEAGWDVALGGHWGFIFLAGMQSPFMDEKDLRVAHVYAKKEDQNQYQVSSAWNSLVAWRGRQSLGPRLRWSAGEMSLLATEDWGFGARDPDGSLVYVDNAPDLTVGFYTQLYF